MKSHQRLVQYLNDTFKLYDDRRTYEKRLRKIEPIIDRMYKNGQTTIKPLSLMTSDDLVS